MGTIFSAVISSMFSVIIIFFFLLLLLSSALDAFDRHNTPDVALAQEADSAQGASDAGTIENNTIGDWLGFFGLGSATSILVLYRFAGRNDDDRKRKQLLKYSITVLAIASGIIHILLIPEHAMESLIFGTFFGISGAALIAYAIIVIISDKKGIYYLGIAGAIILIGLYLFTRLVTVPFSPEGGVEKISIVDIVTKIVEAMMLSVLIYLLRIERGRHQQLATKN